MMLYYGGKAVDIEAIVLIGPLLSQLQIALAIFAVGGCLCTLSVGQLDAIFGSSSSDLPGLDCYVTQSGRHSLLLDGVSWRRI